MSDQQAATALARELRGLHDLLCQLNFGKLWLDLVRDAAAALASPDAAAPRLGTGWNPIETAPKFSNDTRLLVARPDGWVTIANWAFLSEAWLANGVKLNPQPTHWMDLPASPDAAAVLGSTPQEAETRDSIVMAADAMRLACVARLRRAIAAARDSGLLPLNAEECCTILEMFAPEVPEAPPKRAVLGAGTPPQEPYEKVHADINAAPVDWRTTAYCFGRAVDVVNQMLTFDREGGNPAIYLQQLRDGNWLPWMRGSSDRFWKHVLELEAAERAAAAGPAPETPRESTPEPLVALVAHLIGRYANHDEDCPKRAIVGRPYSEQATCSCGYLEDVQVVFGALAAPVPHAAPGELSDETLLQLRDVALTNYATRRESLAAMRAVLTAAAKGTGK